MAFQPSAFQGGAFQTEIPVPPEPPVPQIAGTIEYPTVRRSVRAVFEFRARIRVRLIPPEEAIRERVREFLSSLIG
jgi:hypothetical protein